MNPRNASSVKFNFASDRNPAAFRHYPAQKSKRYGTGYARIRFVDWAKGYDHQRVGTALERIGSDSDAERGINSTERAILAHLHGWDAVHYPGKRADAAAIGKLTHRAPQNVNKTLRRLGRAHVIVNAGGDRAPNMRVNGKTEEWDMTMLFHERNADLVRISHLHRRSVEAASEAAKAADASDPNLSLELRKHRELMAKTEYLALVKFKDLWLSRSPERQRADRTARLAQIPEMVAAFSSASQKAFQGENNGLAWAFEASDAALLSVLVYWDDESGMIHKLHKHPSGGRASAPAITDAINRAFPDALMRADDVLYPPAKRRLRQISRVQTQLAYLACWTVLVNQGERWRPDYQINWRLEEWDWDGLAREAAVHYPKPREHSPAEKAWLAQLGATPCPI